MSPRSFSPSHESETMMNTQTAAAVPDNYLSINNIEVIYDHVILVLKGVSLNVPKGKIVALLGANGAGKGNLQDKSKIGTILYNRGVSAAVLSVEAIRKGQEKYGKGKALNGEQTRWALENLDITDARLKAIGATNLLPQIKTSCDNHEGSGKVKIQQWDGAKWVPVSDWIEGNKALIHPLFQASAKQYAKEKGITPRDCSKEK